MTYRTFAEEEARALVRSGSLWPLDEWDRISLRFSWRTMRHRYAKGPLVIESRQE